MSVHPTISTQPLILKKIIIKSFGAKGKCIAHYDSKVILVSDASPGDLADITITKSKKQYLEGFISHLYQESKLRTQPFCEHHLYCGGCSWQHIHYPEQLIFKKQEVIDNFQKITPISLPTFEIIPSPKQQAYRNKLEFTFSPHNWTFDNNKLTKEKKLSLGFHLPLHFDKIFDVKNCFLQPSPSNDIRLATREYAIKHNLSCYDAKIKRGLLKSLIIRTSSKGMVMLILQAKSLQKQAIFGLLKHLQSLFPQIISLKFAITYNKKRAIHQMNIQHYWGMPTIQEEVSLKHLSKPLLFNIGPKSFFQTNIQQMINLYQVGIDFLNLKKNEIVYDLYSGIGTISCIISPLVKKVIAIESTREAVQDAQKNTLQNNLANISFITGEITQFFNPSLIQKEGFADCVILDPPRSGLHPDIITNLIKIKPTKILYISCNTASQARDLKGLLTHYDLIKNRVIDIFPHTHHLENIVLLTLNTNN